MYCNNEKNVLACKSSIIPPRFIDVHVLIQKCEQLCIYVLGVSILSLRFYDFSFGFLNCSDSLVIFVLFFNLIL
jgi:hypothetical protein